MNSLDMTMKPETIQQLIKKQNMKVVGINFLDTVHDTEEKRIQYVLNSSKLTSSHSLVSAYYCNSFHDPSL
jgi:hypothetical protein